MTVEPEATVAEPDEISEPDFTDIAMGRMAEQFPELFTQAEETLEAETPSVEVAPEPEVEAQVETPAETDEVRRNAAGRAIDEQGRFIPEPGDETPAETPTAAQPDPALAAAQQAAQQAQQRVERLEQQMQELQAGVNQRLTVPPDELAEMVDDDPRRAAHVARAQGDLQTVDEALRAWAAEGPAESYEASAFRAETERRIAVWEAQQAAAQQHAADHPAQADLTPIAQVIEAHPDLPALQPQMDEIVKSHPLLQAALHPDNNPAIRADALNTLYVIAKSQHVDTVTAQAAQAASAEQAAQAREARDAAAVVSATQNGGTEPPTDGADLIRNMFTEGAIAGGFMQPE